MIVFFDTETTGLSPGGIIQLAYIMHSKEKTVGKNFFFYLPYIQPAATAVHGITVEKLAKLSQGHTFSEYLEEIDDDFRAASLTVAHNFPFDFSFMTSEFAKNDRIFHYKESLDTMRFFKSQLKLPSAKSSGKYKYPKLIELADYYGVYDYDVTKQCIKLFGDCESSHDARFDTAQMYLSVITAANTNLELSEIISANLSERVF